MTIAEEVGEGAIRTLTEMEFEIEQQDSYDSNSIEDYYFNASYYSTQYLAIILIAGKINFFMNYDFQTLSCLNYLQKNVSHSNQKEKKKQLRGLISKPIFDTNNNYCTYISLGFHISKRNRLYEMPSHMVLFGHEHTLR